MSGEKTAEKKFRTVFGGGYHKDDVNEYIRSAEAEFVSVENTLKNTINRQKEQIDALQAQLAAVRHSDDALKDAQAACEELKEALRVCTEEKTGAEDARADAEHRIEALAADAEAQKEREDALQAQLADFRNASDAMQAEFAELSACRDRQNAAMTEAQAEAQAAKEEAAMARAELEQLRAVSAEKSTEPVQNVPSEDYDAMKAKAEQYDRMSSLIGAIMLKANAGADEITKKAQEEAADIAEKARAEAEEMLNGVNAELSATRVRAEACADHLIDDIGGRMLQINADCRDDILLDLEDIRGSLNAMLNAVMAKYDDIGKKLDFARSEMEQSAKTAIRDATQQRALKLNADAEHAPEQEIPAEDAEAENAASDADEAQKEE